MVTFSNGQKLCDVLVDKLIKVGFFSFLTQSYESLVFVVYKVPLETARRKNNRFFFLTSQNQLLKCVDVNISCCVSKICSLPVFKDKL